MLSGAEVCKSCRYKVKSFQTSIYLQISVLIQLLLLPHSLFPCVHGMLWYRSRRKERMMSSYLEKGLGPSLLVERLLELSCAVKSNKPHSFLRKL